MPSKYLLYFSLPEISVGTSWDSCLGYHLTKMALAPKGGPCLNFGNAVTALSPVMEEIAAFLIALRFKDLAQLCSSTQRDKLVLLNFIIAINDCEPRVIDFSDEQRISDLGDNKIFGLVDDAWNNLKVAGLAHMEPKQRILELLKEAA